MIWVRPVTLLVVSSVIPVLVGSKRYREVAALSRKFFSRPIISHASKIRNAETPTETLARQATQCMALILNMVVVRFLISEEKLKQKYQ